MSYLSADADLIRRCLPAGTEVPTDTDELFVLYAVLLRVKGEDTQAHDVHDAWSAWMLRTDPDHDSIRPFSELDEDVREEDEPFAEAIRAAARARLSA